jgi:hypothetical protein
MTVTDYAVKLEEDYLIYQSFKEKMEKAEAQANDNNVQPLSLELVMAHFDARVKT